MSVYTSSYSVHGVIGVFSHCEQLDTGQYVLNLNIDNGEYYFEVHLFSDNPVSITPLAKRGTLVEKVKK